MNPAPLAAVLAAVFAGPGPDSAAPAGIEAHRKACDAGDARSCNELSLRHATGEGADLDPRRAEAYYRRAIAPFDAIDDTANRCLDLSKLADARTPGGSGGSGGVASGLSDGTLLSGVARAEMVLALAKDLPDRTDGAACRRLEDLMTLREALDLRRCEAGVAESCRRALLRPGSDARSVRLYLLACRNGAADACESVATAFETSSRGAAPLPVEETLALADALRARARDVAGRLDPKRSRDVLHVCDPSCRGDLVPAIVRAITIQTAFFMKPRRESDETEADPAWRGGRPAAGVPGVR